MTGLLHPGEAAASHRCSTRGERAVSTPDESSSAATAGISSGPACASSGRCSRPAPAGRGEAPQCVALQRRGPSGWENECNRAASSPHTLGCLAGAVTRRRVASLLLHRTGAQPERLLTAGCEGLTKQITLLAAAAPPRHASIRLSVAGLDGSATRGSRGRCDSSTPRSRRSLLVLSATR
jgi:hypothetical protein